MQISAAVLSQETSELSNTPFCEGSFTQPETPAPSHVSHLSTSSNPLNQTFSNLRTASTSPRSHASSIYMPTSSLSRNPSLARVPWWKLTTPMSKRPVPRPATRHWFSTAGRTRSSHAAITAPAVCSVDWPGGNRMRAREGRPGGALHCLVAGTDRCGR